MISTKQSTILSFLLRDDVYDEQRLRADEEALRRFYYNRGYADFRVVSASGDLDEATNTYTVTITVDEGDRYTFGDVSRRELDPRRQCGRAAVAGQDPLRRRLQRQECRGHRSLR